MITEMITGGFGDLAQGAGAGVQSYRQEQEAAATRADFDALTKWAGEAQASGMSPQQAAYEASQRFPHLMGGQGGQGAPQGAPPQGLNVPSSMQPNVVPRAIGPSSPMPGTGMGGLAAQPPAQPPSQSEQAYTVGQTSPALEQALAAGDSTRSAPRPLGTVPRDQTPIEYPPTAPQAGQRIQQTQAARGPAQQMQGGRGPMPVTPRNLPYAQLLMQQQNARENVGGRLSALETRRDIAGMQDQTKRDIAGANNQTRRDIAEASIRGLIQRATQSNDTRILAILKGFDAQMAKLTEEAQDRGQRGALARAKLSQNAAALKAVTQMYGAASNAAANSGDPKQQAQADAMFAASIEMLKTDSYEQPVEITPEQRTTVEEPGFFGPNTTTKKTPPSAKIPGAGAPKPKQPPAAKTVVKTETNKRTGQKRITYSDGTTEVR